MMRILVLAKRQYTGKDLLTDRYGRLYEIPAQLAVRGHEVVGVALSYRKCLEGSHHYPEYLRLLWYAFNAFPFGIFRYIIQITKLAREFRPDIIWASSDAIHAIIGHWLGNKFRIPCVIDLYDNYESFGLSRLPGITPLLRNACRHANGLTVVSQQLLGFVENNYCPSSHVAVIQNGIDEKVFFPKDRTEARQHLGLPLTGKLVGIAGAITSDRGIEDLFDAFLHLAEDDENLWLVLAGPRDKTPSRYRHKNIIDLGTLPHARVADLFSALDVAVVCNLDSDFGRYCFPQKFYEITACGTPLIATDVGEVHHLLDDWPDSLYPAGNWRELAKRIKRQLESPSPIRVRPRQWDELTNEVERFFSEVTTSR